MKRLLLFLLLFGLGLAVLLLIERKREPTVVPQATPGSSNSASRPAAEQGPRGEIGFTLYDQHDPDRGPRLLTFSGFADGAPTESGDQECRAVHIVRYDPVSGAEVATIDAATGRFSTPSAQGPFGVKLGTDVLLREATARITQGGPLAPMTLQSPELSGDLMTQVFESSRPSRIEGEGLVASGEGLYLSLLDQKLSFAHDAEATLALPGARSLSLTCAGGMNVTTPNEVGTGLFSIDASDKARLELTGGESLWLSAEHISLGAVAGAAPEDGLSLRDVHCSGAVHVERSGVVLDGQSAHFALEPDGTPQKLLLEGAPHARFPLGSAAESKEPAVLSGQGPLEMSLAGPTSYAMTGPAELAWAGAKLGAQGGLSGALAASPAEDSTISAWTMVTLDQAGQRLSTERLDADMREQPGGARLLRARATGASKLDGTTQDGSPFALSTTEELIFEQDGDAWRMPLARAAVLELRGEQPLTAKADRVLDFDPKHKSFRAEGRVEIEGRGVRGAGERLTVLSRESLVLEGGAQSLAWIERAGRRAQAVRLALDGELLTAKGDVTAELSLGERHFLVLGDELSIRQREHKTESGGLERRFELSAASSVQATVTQGEERYELACSTLEGTRVEGWRNSVMVGARSTLVAHGVLKGALVLGEQRWGIVCESLLASNEEPAEAGGIAGRIDAYGNVAFERSSGLPLRGRGDHLEITGQENGRLSAESGKRVHAEGTLPARDQRLFTLDAQWASFAGDEIEAHAPDLLVVPAPREILPGAPVQGVDAIRVQAGHLLYRQPHMELSERGTLSGFTPEGVPYALTGDLIAFDVLDTPSPLAARVQGLSARGNFELSFGELARARGDDLILVRGQALLRMTGSPARIVWAGVGFSSGWIELDLRLRTLRTGSGRVGPRGREAFE